MADDKKGRDKQAHDEANRQREREMAAELERGDEPEPPIDTSELDVIETELGEIAFPATGAEVVGAVGEQQLEAPDTTYRIEQLVPDTDSETFDSPAAVSMRVQRPTVAGAMKRVVEATDTLSNTELAGSQRTGYEKTFRALKAVDVDDDDEGVTVVCDWIVEQIREKETIPGSRAVRRRAAKFCRTNGYEIRNDEWLGV